MMPMGADVPIQLDGVSKSYGSLLAVSGLSLTVPSRGVYGFLGPNGAGKSTTMRMALGLQKPDRGRIFLFGKPLASHRIEILGRVGSLIESPSLYQHLTGRENLEIHRRLLNLSKGAIDEALETVGLARVADRAARSYSSGMKQRLGLAVALLGNPELLVLDEPTNGLDPEGIREIRTILRDLPKRRNVTVFISSHLLSEIEQTATHIGIISHGVLRFEGTPEELRLRSSQMIAIEVDQPDKACSLLEERGVKAARDGNAILVEPDGSVATAEINRILVAAGVAVSHLAVHRRTLEELFLDLTSDAPQPKGTLSR
jgi:lantibiotic transport system ATP-binding protein